MKPCGSSSERSASAANRRPATRPSVSQTRTDICSGLSPRPAASIRGRGVISRETQVLGPHLVQATLKPQSPAGAAPGPSCWPGRAAPRQGAMDHPREVAHRLRRRQLLQVIEHHPDRGAVAANASMSSSMTSNPAASPRLRPTWRTGLSGDRPGTAARTASRVDRKRAVSSAAPRTTAASSSRTRAVR
jgi:hypothetical protein